MGLCNWMGGANRAWLLLGCDPVVGLGLWVWPIWWGNVLEAWPGGSSQCVSIALCVSVANGIKPIKWRRGLCGVWAWSVIGVVLCGPVWTWLVCWEQCIGV